MHLRRVFIWGPAEQVAEQVFAQCHITAHHISKSSYSAISMKSSQYARLGPCRASFRKVSLLLTLDHKIVLLATNHRQIRKAVRVLWNMYKTHVLGHAEQVWQNPTFEHTRSQILVLASNHRQIAKTVWFLWKVHKTYVRGRAEQVLAKSYFWTLQI